MGTERLDSNVFFGIPRKDLNTNDYRRWIDFKLLPDWLGRREENQEYRLGHHHEGGIHGKIGSEYVSYCKFYKFDGTGKSYGNPRGLMIRDHFSEADVKKVHMISDNFEAYLKENRIKYRRMNRER